MEREMERGNSVNRAHRHIRTVWVCPSLCRWSKENGACQYHFEASGNLL